MKAVFLLLSLLVLHAYAKEFTTIDENTFLENAQNGANNFSFNLFKTALKKKTGNFIISPFSTYMVLAMASYGAQGVTREELEEVLHLPKETEDTTMGTRESLAAINAKFMMLYPVFLCLSNKIFARSDIFLDSYYQNILREIFLSPLVAVNFKNPKEAGEQINSWSKRSTFGKIEEIVSADELNDDMTLMLVNSVYFYGHWKVPFNPEFTFPRSFRVSKELTKDVPTMVRDGEFQIGRLNQMDATFVVLPYQNGGNQEDATYMYFILPNRVDGLAKIEDNIDSLTLKDLHNTKEYKLDLHVPKFRLESTIKLNDHLTEMGIRSAFSNDADFGGMTRRHQNLAINKIIQKAVISIDEKRTDAAGTTGIENKIGPETYRINRPFLILLATEDVILFTGKVVDPTLSNSLLESFENPWNKSPNIVN